MKDSHGQLPVFVIHWNAPDWCEETVASLLRSEGVELDVTVIDNASSRLPRVPLSVAIDRCPRNCGYSGAANRAVELAGDAPLFVIASHDVSVAPTTLKLIVDRANDAGGVGIVGPNFGWRTLEEDYLSGSLMLLRRDCVADVGRFDTIFGSYCEEVDYCHRALARGWQLSIVDDANAWTRGSRHRELAERLTDANYILLAVKERRWRGAIRGFTDLVRRRRWSSASLALRQVARLTRRTLSAKAGAFADRRPN